MLVRVPIAVFAVVAVYIVYVMSMQWSCAGCGKSVNVAHVFQGFLHPDGSFGPLHEPYVYRTMVDLQRRGFCIQIRWVCSAVYVHGA